MSDPIRESFVQFHRSIAASYQVLNDNRTRIEDRKAQMLRLLETSIKIPEPPPGAGDYQDICRETMSGAKIQLQNWQNFIKGQIQRSEFVNRHEKSILALVFADVNAGKSSLGNFVGGWDLRETPYADLYTPHDCEIEDFSKASKENRQVRVIDHFAENATEATSTIQHYTLQQGLTWVDTPGLHSLTTEHGDLAKEYIQFADLVIYLTPSSSPFKADEREMLGELFQMGKPVILAITKSDITRQKVANGRIVNVRLPKPAENRNAQETFVTEQVRQISGSGNLENSHVLSLSVPLARDAVTGQDAALYAASNLDKFLSQMGAILSNKAIELKMRRPKAEVNAFIDRLIGNSGRTRNDFLTITQLRSELSQKCKNLQIVLAECRKEEEKICADIELQLPTALSLLLRDLRNRGKISDTEAVREAVSAAVSELTEAVCTKRLKKKLGSLVLSIRLPGFVAETAPEVEYKVEYAEQILTKVKKREARGLWEHIQSFLGKKDFQEIVNESESIRIGDNLKSYLDAQVETLRPRVREHISGVINHMASACVIPLQECYQELDKQLENLSEELERLRFAEKSEE